MTNPARIWMVAFSMMALAGPGFGSGISLINSYWSPADFSDDYGPGIKLQASMSELFDLEFRASLFPDMGEDVIDGEDKITVDLSVTPMELGIFANVPYIYDPLVQPYFGTGVGYYLIDLSAKGPAGSIDYDVDNEIGFFLLTGARLYFTPELVLIGEVMYRIVEGEAKTKAEEGSNPDIGFNLNGFGGSVGLGLMW